ncbi:MAG: 50S ribosomal protein L20 [Acholeplasmataceae bacterium]|jgi:large subunit ribosomal protein L20|nr:50S ribosomal protein L20 [Acholeplasmataceae bacterium]
MPRVKSSVQTRRRRKKILKMSKGYFGSKRTLYRTANEQVMRSLQYSYVSRKLRKRDFRKLWIQRINAACKLHDYQYSKFIFGLSLANIKINRKMLADMAVYDEAGFKELVEVAKEAVKNAPLKEKAPLQERISLNGKSAKVVPQALKEKKEEIITASQEVEKEVKVESVDYSAYTVSELREIAKDNELSGYSSLKKAELIEFLEKNVEDK